jgi:CheY-like chemotaxis protein
MRELDMFGDGNAAGGRPTRSVVAVSRNPRPEQIFDALTDADDYDIIVVESIARGYSRIKQLAPDLIVVYLEMGDAAACRLLSMLKMDGDLCGIPVVTCATSRPECTLEDILAELIGESTWPAHAMVMN